MSKLAAPLRENMSQDNSEPTFRPFVSRFSQPDAPSDGQNQDGKTPAGGPEKPHQDASLIEDFGRSLLHTVAQNPVNALVQPIDKAFGTHILPNVQFIDAPQAAKFGTANYWAQQTGSAVGMLGTFWVAGKGVKAFTRAGMTEEMMASTLSRQSQIGLTMKEATMTGFVHDFAFRPIEDGDKRNYLVARLSNGVTGGATMFTLAGVGVGLKQLGAMASVERSAMLPVGESAFSKTLASTVDKLRFNVATPLLKSEIAGGVISAVPAGLISANSNTFLKDRRLATGQENYESVLTMGVLGAGFGAHQQFKGRFESGRQNFEWAPREPMENGQSTAEFKVVGGEKALTDALAKVRGGDGAMVKVREHIGEGGGWRRFLGMQDYGPEKNLFIQHNDAAKGINYDAARMADILAICNLDPTLQEKAAVTGDNVSLRAGKDRVRISSDAQEVKEGESKPIPLGDRTQNFSDNIVNLRSHVNAYGEESSVNDIVRQQLKATGLEDKGWRSAVTEKGSLMDMVGADIVLYNEKSGQMYMLDCTEQSKNPPAIRAAGIIEIQKSWFRAASNGPEMPEWFPAEVGQILLKATGEVGNSKPTLNLRDIQLPSIKAATDVEQLTEMRSFVHDLERLPTDPNFRGNRGMIDEYTQRLKDTTLDHLEWTVHGTPNKEVTRSAVDVAKDTVLDYFLGKRDQVAPNIGDTDIFIKHDNLEPENHELRFRSSHGDRIQIGKMGAVLEQARKEMLPLSLSRAHQVETSVEGIRTQIKMKEAVLESIQEKRQRAQTWDELQSLNEELRLAREDHKQSVDNLKQWQPENSILQRLKKAGRTVGEFGDFLMRDQSVIRNGGRVGVVDPNRAGPIEQALKNNLSHRSEEFLFKNAGSFERPLKPSEEAGLSAASAKDFVTEVNKEWGQLELEPGKADDRVALSLMQMAETNPTINKLVDGYEKGDPEAIRIVHRLLTER